MSLPNTWTDGVNSYCSFSPDRRYRFWLIRSFRGIGCGRRRACIGLNPSTADETKDDRTVRRLAEWAYRDGFDEFQMLNLFAYRATNPADMMAHSEPIGWRTDMAIFFAMWRAEQIVLCWGNHGSHLGRSAQVLEMLRPHAHKLYRFGLTKSGEPRHPLYLPRNTPLVKWEYVT